MAVPAYPVQSCPLDGEVVARKARLGRSSWVEAGSFCHPTKPAATARWVVLPAPEVMAPQIIQFPGGAPPAPLPATLVSQVRPRHDVAGTRAVLVVVCRRSAYAPMASTAAAATVGITVASA